MFVWFGPSINHSINRSNLSVLRVFSPITSRFVGEREALEARIRSLERDVPPAERGVVGRIVDAISTMAGSADASDKAPSGPEGGDAAAALRAELEKAREVSCGAPGFDGTGSLNPRPTLHMVILNRISSLLQRVRVLEEEVEEHAANINRLTVREREAREEVRASVCIVWEWRVVRLDWFGFMRDSHTPDSIAPIQRTKRWAPSARCWCAPGGSTRRCCPSKSWATWSTTRCVPACLCACVRFVPHVNKPLVVSPIITINNDTNGP